jgi:putative transposase
MFYIDYNMMRNGVVNHPEQWKHSGYNELIGNKTRYRVTNFPRLLSCLGIDNPQVFKTWYSNTINANAEFYMERQAYWTEAAVVGSWDWIEAVSSKIGIKRRTKVEVIENRKIYDKDNDFVMPQISESRVAYAVR